MSTPKQNPEDCDADGIHKNAKCIGEDANGIGAALRRDAQRIEDAPFDLSLHSAGMARVRAAGEANCQGFRFGLIPALATGSIALAALAIFFHSFLVKPSPESKAVAVAEVSAAPHVHDRASIWFYEMAVAQSDDAFSAALERDAQTLLPASPQRPESLL